MIKRLKPKSDFSRNVLTLMTGTTISQAIPIAIIPILTRIYTPEDFGVLTLFIAVSSILGSIANGRYELAIMLPEKDEDAINIAALGLLIAAVISVVLLIPIFFLNQPIASLLGNKEIEYWLYFVPFVVFMTGLYNVLNYLNTRKKLYRDIAQANVYKSVGMASAQLSVGFIKSGASGLIIGQIIAQTISNYRLAINVKQNYDTAKVTKGEIKRLAKRYVDFPAFSMWAILANTLAYHLTNILISIYYSIATVGFYSLSQKILGLPTALIGGSIGQVFFQEAVKEKQKTGKAINTFDRTSKKLFLISFIFFTPLYFFIPSIFEISFGSRWIVAGEYARIILPLVAVQFIAAALSNINNIFEKQKIALMWQVGLLMVSLSILVYSSFQGYGFVVFLKIYSLIISLYYIFLYFILKKVAQGLL
jgi:O-antigen/teichoic acid export membrane protein